jgi:hypothetical protein
MSLVGEATPPLPVWVPRQADGNRRGFLVRCTRRRTGMPRPDSDPRKWPSDRPSNRATPGAFTAFPGLRLSSLASSITSPMSKRRLSLRSRHSKYLKTTG